MTHLLFFTYGDCQDSGLHLTDVVKIRIMKFITGHFYY